MKKIIISIVSILLFGCGATSPVKEDLGYKGQNQEGFAVGELLEKLKSDPNVQVREERGWQIAEVKSERALYSFTPETHPAHPSYVKREVVEKDGSIYIQTSVSCGAEKSVCDQLVRDFIELNNKVKSGFSDG
ncbi:hypothetical protein MAH1_16880 [Sessilibacter sp. MAH1]